jgi:hypothetical protein
MHTSDAAALSAAARSLVAALAPAIASTTLEKSTLLDLRDAASRSPVLCAI